MDVKYLQKCMDLNVCPEKFKFKIPKKMGFDRNEVHKTGLKQQIQISKMELTTAEQRFQKTKTEVFSKLLMKLLTNKFKENVEEALKVHNRKLINLWRKQRHRSPKCMTNLSDKTLSLEEEESLRYGLGHHILPKKMNEAEIKVNIEKLTYSSIKHSQTKPNYAFRNKVRYEVQSFTNAGNDTCRSRSNQTLHRTLSNLGKDESIKVCKYDKGKGVTILNSSDYFAKLDIIVNDKSKFIEIEPNSDINKHPVVIKGNSIKRYINKYIKDNERFTNNNNNLTVGTSPGKLYGLAKVHKSDVPMRPVCSMINTPEHGFAKFLDNIIKSHIPDEFMLNSTNAFLDDINDFNFLSTDKLVSFDVVSLFTNVPLKETIDLIAEYIYKAPNALPFKKLIFKRMMLLATQGYFLYNDKLYQQIDGVIMGSPLGPTLANFFLAHIECKLLKNNNNDLIQPIFYRRYVDDIFAVFRDNSYVPFLELLNSQHPRLKFTVEVACETLTFLDVEIKINDGNLQTWVFRKPTHTGLLLNFSAIAPRKWKFGLITCLLNRAKVICSNSFFDQEVRKLKTMFLNNGYPERFFQGAYDRFLAKQIAPILNSSIDPDSNPWFMLKIPYIGYSSKLFAKRISKLYSETFGIDIKVVYTTCKIQNYFQLKSRTQKPLCSNVVYKFTCSCDMNLTYIGMTTRHLGKRVEEHLDFKQKDDSSAILDHLRNCHECHKTNKQKNLNNFEIIRTCRSEYETKIHEALLIRKFQPKLNVQQFNNGASFLLNIY